MFNTIKKVIVMRTANEKVKMQMVRGYKVFTQKSMKMNEVDVHTLVISKNNCSLIKELLDQRLIVILRSRKCTDKGYPYVDRCIGNSDLFPQSNQIKMV